jgi:hypothetical protein
MKTDNPDSVRRAQSPNCFSNSRLNLIQFLIHGNAQSLENSGSWMGPRRPRAAWDRPSYDIRQSGRIPDRLPLPFLNNPKCNTLAPLFFTIRVKYLGEMFYTRIRHYLGRGLPLGWVHSHIQGPRPSKTKTSLGPS